MIPRFDHKHKKCLLDQALPRHQLAKLPPKIDIAKKSPRHIIFNPFNPSGVFQIKVD